jgi:hypothetical protein
MLLTARAPIPLRTMLLAWALAEPNEWGAGRPEPLVRKVADGAPLTDADQDEAVRWLLAGRRGRETLILRTLGVTWYESDFPVVELGSVVLHRHWAINHWGAPLSSTRAARTVAEIADYPDGPASFRGDRTPDPARTQPPILLATDPHGPWRIAEGNHRAVAIWRSSQGRPPVPKHVRRHPWRSPQNEHLG